LEIQPTSVPISEKNFSRVIVILADIAAHYIFLEAALTWAIPVWNIGLCRKRLRISENYALRSIYEQSFYTNQDQNGIKKFL